MTNADFTKRSAIFIALALVPFLIWLLFDVVLMVVGALLVADLLELGARPLLRFSTPRAVALLLSGSIIIIALAGAAFLFGAGVASELQDVLQRIEQARDTIGKELRGSPIGEVLLSQVKSANIPVAELVGGFFRTSSMFLLSLLVTIFAGIYIASQPALYRQGVTALFTAESRSEIDATIDHLSDGLRLWLLGQLIQMLIIGTLSGLVTWLIGLPSPLALGVIAGVAEFIPYLGPIISAIPAVLVAVTQGAPAMAWTLGAYLLIHQTEGHLLTPLIQRQMVYIPPAVILFGIAAIGSLFGLAGTIFAAPITVSIFVLIKKLYVRDSLGKATLLPGERTPRRPGFS